MLNAFRPGINCCQRSFISMGVNHHAYIAFSSFINYYFQLCFGVSLLSWISIRQTSPFRPSCFNKFYSSINVYFNQLSQLILRIYSTHKHT